MHFKYPRIGIGNGIRKLDLTRENWKFVVMRSRHSRNYKTGHFMSWNGRERQQNVEKWQLHEQIVQNYCFSMFNMQICDAFVTAVGVDWLLR